MGRKPWSLDRLVHPVFHSRRIARQADGGAVAQLEIERSTWLLDLLAAGKAEHKTRSTWQLWQEGYHPQAIYSDQTMLQKIDYIPANPVRRGWVTSPEHWRYSSAHEWLPGAQSVLRCDSWR